MFHKGIVVDNLDEKDNKALIMFETWNLGSLIWYQLPTRLKVN